MTKQICPQVISDRQFLIMITVLFKVWLRLFAFYGISYCANTKNSLAWCELKWPKTGTYIFSSRFQCSPLVIDFHFEQISLFKLPQEVAWKPIHDIQYMMIQFQDWSSTALLWHRFNVWTKGLSNTVFNNLEQIHAKPFT